MSRILAHGGGQLRLAAPLGLGKPNVLLNALYRAVVADPNQSLHIFTALSLARPAPKSDLERRFLGRFLDRHFGADYPDLDYAVARRDGTLPARVRVSEFYLQSGALLDNAQAQREYASLNYTHVARDLAGAGINVVVQLVARRVEDGRERLSLASNPDVTQDLIDEMASCGRPRPLVVGVVHPRLPFVANEAEVNADFFDLLLDDPACDHTLFALPREPVSAPEFALGLHASTLVRDGGTLQIGIGALSDAVVHALLLRQRDNAAYREALAAVGGAHPLTEAVGGLSTFERGLYGASEMVMDGFMHLARGGVLKRRVFDDFAIEQALAEGAIGETLKTGDVERLYASGALPGLIHGPELARLMRCGLLPEGCTIDGDQVQLPDGATVPCDLREMSARAALGRAMTGRRLRDGRYLRGAFYLGSVEFYRWLSELDGDDFDGVSMTRVSDINQLYGGRETLDALQRRDGRFFNTCMMATALGAAVSDALEDGRVVSGVGGQYNFVAMAHALRDGRSVLLLRACRGSADGARSSIRWNYGHTTIPRHLRDVFVTEYGVADLRGKSDEDCVKAMLAVSDARFVDGLVAQAKAAGKLAAGFAVPEAWRRNTPEFLSAALAPLRKRGLFDAFPFGTDFTPVELQLAGALQWLKQRGARRGGRITLLLSALRNGTPRVEEAAALERMGLDSPQTLAEKWQRRLVLTGLRR
ncbi:MAG TPA: acetyl-CoA hydrolase/transferase C-terminal domain-containing protein [Tahibacter sp.]|nr:acetyl-CoA hydrolase/transferase C-terminal domain-containing protein [Tahibacter sp.]HSX59642.1 acetyl-CoA hydrolase/transferase C-terminal domain-containing protein [Tahibacter sp.]